MLLQKISEVALILRSNVANVRNKTTFVRYKVILWDIAVMREKDCDHPVWYHKEGLNSLFSVVPQQDETWSFGTYLSSDHCDKRWAVSLTATYLISEVRHETVTSPPASSGAPMLFHGPLRPKDNQPCILESVRASNTSASPNTVTTTVPLLKIQVFSPCTRPNLQKE